MANLIPALNYNDFSKVSKYLSSMASGLKPVLRKYCKIMYSIALDNFSTNTNIKNHKIDQSFESQGLRPLRSNKTGINLIIFVNVRGNLSRIRCDKSLLSYV